MAKVFVIASLAESLLNFRGDLIRHLIERGHVVVTAAPDGPADVDRTLAEWGVRRLSIGLERTGANLLADLKLLFELRRLLRAERPDVVLAYTIKPVVYGALAARWAGVPRRAAMITGLGFAFAPPTTLRQRVVRAVARGLYRAGMACTDTVFFQNPDDEADFRRAGLLRPEQGIVRTGGSGVNLNRFAALPLPEGPLRFLMIARLLVNKGVREYLQAAASARRERPELQFHLVGPFDPHPSAVPRDEIEAAVEQGAVIYHGAASDVRPHLANCHVYVLPSYREGTPRSVLEAMAVGRAIVTTDAPGCRETVVPGDNGMLVAPGQAEPLAQALLKMASLPRQEISRMAARSREIAETRFDVGLVNNQIANALSL
jgi:glycosyltransferase involved in cell wall biosynthesis